MPLGVLVECMQSVTLPGTPFEQTGTASKPPGQVLPRYTAPKSPGPWQLPQLAEAAPAGGPAGAALRSTGASAGTVRASAPMRAGRDDRDGPETG